MTISFKQFNTEQTLVESLTSAGLVEEIVNQQDGDWSPELTADELFEELGIGSNI